MKDNESRLEDFRTVIVRGTTEQAQKAEYLIHKTVADVPQRVEEILYVPTFAVGRTLGKLVSWSSTEQLRTSQDTLICCCYCFGVKVKWE